MAERLARRITKLLNRYAQVLLHRTLRDLQLLLSLDLRDLQDLPHVQMINGMRTHLHAIAQHLTQLWPCCLSLPTNFSGDDIEHATKSMLLEHWIGIFICIVITIIKRQYNGLLWQWSTVIESIEELIERNRMKPLCFEVIQMCLKHIRVNSQTLIEGTQCQRKRNMVIHHNRHLHSFLHRGQWRQD